MSDGTPDDQALVSVLASPFVGVSNDALELIGVGHLARGGGHAELGVSVLPAHRGRGIGGTLLARAHLHARNWGVRALFMHCLTENAAMMHLARKQRMELVAHSGEADAWLALAPADAEDGVGAAAAERSRASGLTGR